MLVSRIEPPRLRRCGVRLDASIAQLFGEALAIAKEVIAIRVEAAPVVIAARDRQVDVRVIAIDMKRSDPGSVGELGSRKIQSRGFDLLRIGPARHRQDHRERRRALPTGVVAHLPFLPFLRELLHLASVVDDLLVARVQPQFLVGAVPEAADVGEVREDVAAAMLAAGDAHHHLRNAPRGPLHGRDRPAADGRLRAAAERPLGLGGGSVASWFGRFREQGSRGQAEHRPAGSRPPALPAAGTGRAPFRGRKNASHRVQRPRRQVETHGRAPANAPVQ